MAEFFKKTQEKHKASQEWLNNSRHSFERALFNIDKYQERKLLTVQVILLIFVGAFCVNILSATVFDLSITDLALQRVYLDIGVTGLSIIALIAIFVLLRQQLSKYKPPEPVLVLSIKPEDTEPFLRAAQFKSITEYLEQGKLKDFRVFGNKLFESLSGFFPIMLPKIEEKPIKEYEKQEDPTSKEYPTLIKEYDISPLSTTGVKVTLEVVLAPHVVYSFTTEGDKTASYSFYLIFRFRILNPMHCDANKFLEEYYYLSASNVIEFSSYAIANAFRNLKDFDAKEKKG
jgi:hypothetical protein